MTLTEQIDMLIAEHRLTSLNLTRIKGVRDPFWVIYVHGDGLCASSDHEKTDVSEAIAQAICRLNEKRVVPIVVPALEAA